MLKEFEHTMYIKWGNQYRHHLNHIFSCIYSHKNDCIHVEFEIYVTNYNCDIMYIHDLLSFKNIFNIILISFSKK